MMLACARLGITHSVVFGGFAPHELSIRIDDCNPKVLITASAGLELKKESLFAFRERSHRNVDLQTGKRGRFRPSIIWQPSRLERHFINEFSGTHGEIRAGRLRSGRKYTSVIHSYTSGTTGKPKGVVRDTGGYATALKFL